MDVPPHIRGHRVVVHMIVNLTITVPSQLSVENSPTVSTVCTICQHKTMDAVRAREVLEITLKLKPNTLWQSMCGNVAKKN